jgi:hypothetical protein
VSTNQTVANEKQATATAISNINSTLEDAESGLPKAHSEIVSTNQTVANVMQATATAISNINSTLEDAETGLAKAHSEIVATNRTVAGKASSSALTSLKSRVINEEKKSAAASLVMSAQTDEINGLKAEVFLGVDVNGKITGIYLSGDSNQSLLEFMGDKIQFVNPITNSIDFKWSASQDSFAFRGSINLIGSTHMRLSSPNGFGSSDQFIEWFGPKLLDGSGEPDFSKISESNAISFLKSDGAAYFGGAIVSGTLSTSLSTSSLADNASVVIGPFGSNGGAIAISCSVTMNSNQNYSGSTKPTAPSAPTCSIIMEEYDGGQWRSRQTASYSGSGAVSGSEYEAESHKWYGSKKQSLGGSFTYTDNKKNTTNRQFRLRLTNRNNLYTAGSWGASQRLSITTSES